ncbi:MAG: DegV family protein [Coriobacteriales bacterium]|jgi:DegV family protein with EDD domain|nr:DegV family protein [Coriobacteriales bacterium]
MTERKVNLIFDSCCDLPAKLVQTLDVQLVNFTYTLEGHNYVDDLGCSLSHHDFYERMRAGATPTTTQVSPGQLEEVFESAYRTGRPTLMLTFCAALSGTYQAACLVQRQLKEKHPDFDLRVIDTYLPSCAEGLLVLEAARQAARGLPIDELCAWAEEARYRVHGYFTVDDLHWLKLGGRIPAAAAYLGAKLDMKPLLSYDLKGGLTLESLTRGRKKAIKQVLARYRELHDVAGNPDNTTLVCAADVPEEQAALREATAALAGAGAELINCDIGTVIGSHVGPGMIALVFWGPDRRQA